MTFIILKIWKERLFSRSFYYFLQPTQSINRIVVDTNKFSSVLGNVVQLRGSEKEPVMDIVKEADEKNNVGGIAVDRLRSLIERIERLEEEKKALSGDIRDIFAEAKSAGFDVKIMREILKLRKMNAADRDEQEYLLDTYRKALDLWDFPYFLAGGRPSVVMPDPNDGANSRGNGF